LRGLAGQKKVTGGDGDYTLVVETAKLPTTKELRAAIPEKYSLKTAVLEASGEVEKKDGQLRLTIAETTIVVTLKKTEWAVEPRGEEPYARLKRLFDDGATKFKLSGYYAKDDKGVVLEVASAERE
jgi:predicted nucleic acid-binding Zn ribbon protein